jgi:hypothetical protein
MKKLLVYLTIGLVSCTPYALRESDLTFNTVCEKSTSNNQEANVFACVYDGYTLSGKVLKASILLNIKNTSQESIKFVWDESVFILPDGKTSKVISGQTSWNTRLDSIKPEIVPPGAYFENLLIPLNNLYYNYEVGILNLYLPNATSATIRLFLTIEKQSGKTNHEIIFSGARR